MLTVFRRQTYLKSLLIKQNTEEWQNKLLLTFNKLNDNTNKLQRIAGLDISTVVGDNQNAIVCLTIVNFPTLEVCTYNIFDVASVQLVKLMKQLFCVVNPCTVRPRDLRRSLRTRIPCFS